MSSAQPSNEVVDQTQQQADRLASLKASVLELEKSGGFHRRSRSVRRKESQRGRLLSQRDTLEDANLMLRGVFDLQDDVSKIQFAYLKSNGSLDGDALEAKS
jgi:hypothetical protein